MVDITKQSKAAALFADPLVHEILDNLETTAVNQGVYADRLDDGARQAAMAEVRAIRSLRAKLKSLSTAIEDAEAQA